jgi:hypothetical protein
MFIRRLYRARKMLLLAAASLPLVQTGGCADPISLAASLTSAVGGQIAQGVIIAAISTFAQLLLQAFPGSDFLRAILGGNAGFFNVGS